MTNWSLLVGVSGGMFPVCINNQNGLFRRLFTLIVFLCFGSSGIEIECKERKNRGKSMKNIIG